MKLRLLTAALWMLPVLPAIADLDAVADLGCRPGDPTFDNGAVITAAIRDGRVNDTVHFPGGVYYHSSTVEVNRDSMAVTGQGMARWRRVGAYKATAAAIFVYTGPAEQPAWRVSGDGVRITGLNIWRDFYDGPRSGGVGIEFRDWGKHHISHCGFSGFDAGIHFAPSNHCDESVFESMHFNSCKACVLGRENQSSALDWRGVYVYGTGDTVFDLQAGNGGGGNYHVSTLAINEPRMIFRLRTGSNTCTYSVQNLKVDNNAAGWRLVDSRGPLNLTVRGHIGNQAKPADDAILVRDYMGKPQIADIKLWWGGKVWPEVSP
jgi:hypothetical protein